MLVISCPSLFITLILLTECGGFGVRLKLLNKNTSDTNPLLCSCSVTVYAKSPADFRRQWSCACVCGTDV